MPDSPGYPRSRVMSRIKGKNTGPEVRLRAALHARGVRFRLGQRVDVAAGRPINADLVFKGARVAVFVDGCFWHGCTAHCRMPSSNVEYWERKIDRNVARDRETDARLHSAGWRVVRVWEHADAASSADEIVAVLRETRESSSRSVVVRPSSVTDYRAPGWGT